MTRASVAWLAITTGTCGLSFQDADAQEGMRPVPRFSGTSIRDQRSDSQKAASTSNLQWRTSREVAPAVLPVAATVQPTVTAQPTVTVAPTVSHTDQTVLQVVHAAAERRSEERALTPVVQTRYQNTVPVPGDSSGLQLPPGLKPDAALNTDAAASPGRDFFTDPFGDEAAAPGAAPALEIPKTEVPAINNELRAPSMPRPLTLPTVPDDEPADVEAMEAETSDEVADQAAAPEPEENSSEEAVEAEPAPTPRTRAPQSLRDLDDSTATPVEDANPFDRTRNLGAREDDVSLRRPVEFSCDKFRKSISEATIQTVSLDISPPFRPDVIEVDEFEKLKSKFDEAQEVRDWQSIDGRKLGRGRLKDLAYEKVIIETEFGTLEELPINRVSEADLAYLSKNWGLPQECLIEQVAYQERSWQHSKVTWKASNLCHKPLYFEEVNLERYGHDAGPFAQPIISSAHFFANIAVLPYKMGVHAPSECQYTLGYYRPGNCAPWIVPPVPLSLRGGLYQAAAMTGAFWLIP